MDPLGRATAWFSSERNLLPERLILVLDGGRPLAREDAMTMHTAMCRPETHMMRAFDPVMIGALFANIEMKWSREARARFVVSQLPDLSLIRSTHRATGCVSRRLERHIERDPGGHVLACLPLSGHIQIRHEDGACHWSAPEVVGAGQLGLLRTRAPYEVAMSDALDALWLRIPEPHLAAHVINLDEMLWRPLEASAGLSAFARQMMLQAVDEDTELSARSASILGQALVSFLGDVTASNRALPVRRTRAAGRLLARAEEFIDGHLLEETLSPQMIAAGLGISERYLFDLFAEQGTSPMRWARKRRLELARQELIRGGAGQSVSEIAYSLGFSNMSSFARAFRAEFGITPSAAAQRGGGDFRQP